MHLSLFVSPSLGNLWGVENGKEFRSKGRAASKHGLSGKHLNSSLQSLASQSDFLKPVFAAWAIDSGDWMGGGGGEAAGLKFPEINACQTWPC